MLLVCVDMHVTTLYPEGTLISEQLSVRTYNLSKYYNAKIKLWHAHLLIILQIGLAPPSVFT